MKALRVLICSLFIAVGARTASGQEDKKEMETTSFEIIPYFWMAGMKGTVGVRGLNTDVGVKFSDLVSDLDAGVMLAAKLRLHHWVVSGDFNYVKLSADGEPPGPFFSGSKIDAETFMGSLTVGYRLPMGSDGQVELFAGARGWQLDTEIDFAGGVLPPISVEDDKGWVDPVIGASFEYLLGKSWSLNVVVDVGGFDISSFLTGQVILGVSLRLSDHWQVGAAYRYLADDFEDGNFRWQIAEHGLLLGVGLRF